MRPAPSRCCVCQQDCFGGVSELRPWAKTTRRPPGAVCPALPSFHAYRQLHAWAPSLHRVSAPKRRTEECGLTETTLDRQSPLRPGKLMPQTRGASQLAAHRQLPAHRKSAPPLNSPLPPAGPRMRPQTPRAGDMPAPGAAGGEKLSHLGHGEMFGMLHGDLHSPALCPAPTCSSSGASCVGNTPPFRLILHWTTPRSQVGSDDAIVITMAGFVRLKELNDSSLAAHQALAQLVERRFAGTAARPGQRIELGQAELPRLDCRTGFAARPWILISSIRSWKLFV